MQQKSSAHSAEGRDVGSLASRLSYWAASAGMVLRFKVWTGGDDRYGEVVAFIVPRPGVKPSSDELDALCLDQWRRHMA